MEILSKLFGTAAKVKIMRLFLFNPEVNFDVDDIMARARVERDDVWRELSLLEKVKLIRRRSFYKRSAKKRVNGFILDKEFPYLSGLQKLLIETVTSNVEDFLRRFRALGKLKLVIAAGVFIHSNDSRADLLIVGEGIKRAPLENVIKGIEAEIGRELRYAYFEAKDFLYRLNMFDKLVRDVIDCPHQVLLDRIDLPNLIPQR
jgi:hypothetical protein